VLLAAHGNSLRAIVKMLDGMSEQDILEFNIPTGVPMVYTFDAHLKPLSRDYVGDPEAVRKATEAVARQGKAR
jgi:2,3-bisphosphoglycerate-dependent phosphoglycerate mutase